MYIIFLLVIRCVEHKNKNGKSIFMWRHAGLKIKFVRNQKKKALSRNKFLEL
jgi:hypothetical protein